MSILDHFLANLPEKPYVSSNLGRVSIRPIKKAIDYEYIQPNHPFNIRFIVFDIDKGLTSFFAWEDAAGIQPPNVVVQNNKNGHCHYIYFLKIPIWVKGSGRSAPERYYHAVKDAMTGGLGADWRYTGLLCKNPLHTHWRTTPPLFGELD